MDIYAKVQDCCASTDWIMFWDSSNGIEEYTTSVIGFINKCIDDVVSTVTIHTYPNQKPWITGSIRIELKARAAAFKERDTNLNAFRNPAIPSDEPSNKQRYPLQFAYRLNRSTDLESTLPFPTWTKLTPM